MADYEDQNSSEYKDINQETQAADQNPQNDGQIPPQNPGQNPYWQNQQNSGQFPPQNGQPPYWQNQYNNALLAEPAAAPETRKELLRDDLPDQRDLRSLNALLLRLPGRYHLRRRGSLLRHHLQKRPALQRHRSSRNHPRRYRHSSRHRRVLLCTHHHKLNERPGKRRGIQRVL